MRQLFSSICVRRINKNKMVIGLLLGIAAHISFCSQESRMVLAAQAAMRLSEQYNLNEDQQKMLSARLNEMADPSSGFVDRETAQSVAEGMLALPTQAGPAQVMASEAEEKEESELPAKAGGKKPKPKPGDSQKKLKAKTGTEMIARKALEAMNQKRDGGQLDPQSKLFEQLGGHIASFEPGYTLPWNIQFAPGEVSKKINVMKAAHAPVSASANGRYLALSGQYFGGFKVWNMLASPPLEIKTLDARNFFGRLPNDNFTLSPEGDKIASHQNDMIVVVDIQKEEVLYSINIDADLIGLSFSPHSDELIVYNPNTRILAAYNAQTGDLLRTVDCVPLIESLEKKFGFALRRGFEYVSLDGHKLAIEITSNYIAIFDLQKDTAIPPLLLSEKNKRFYGKLTFNQAGTKLAVITVDEEDSPKNPSLTIWDLNTGKLTCSIKLAIPGSYRHYFFGLAFSPDGGTLLTVYHPDVTAWNLAELERQYATSQAQAGEQESKAEIENKEAAAAPEKIVPVTTPSPQAPAVSPASPTLPTPPVIPVASRKLTVAQAMQKFPGASLPTIRKRNDWVKGLEELAAGSADRKINYKDASELFETIKKRQ